MSLVTAVQHAPVDPDERTTAVLAGAQLLLDSGSGRYRVHSATSTGTAAHINYNGGTGRYELHDAEDATTRPLALIGATIALF